MQPYAWHACRQTLGGEYSAEHDVCQVQDSALEWWSRHMHILLNCNAESLQACQGQASTIPVKNTTDCSRAGAAFTKSWSLTLVLLALAPVLGSVGYGIAAASARLSSRATAAYGDAGALVAEALGNIRTVLALCGAPVIVKAYAAVRAARGAALARGPGKQGGVCAPGSCPGVRQPRASSDVQIMQGTHTHTGLLHQDKPAGWSGVWKAHAAAA